QLPVAFVTAHCVDFYSPMARHLNRNVSGRSESIQAKLGTRTDARQPQTPETYDPCAEKGSCIQVSKSVRYGVHECFGSRDIFRVTAMCCVTGKYRFFAKVLALTPAEFANSAGAMQPRHSNTPAQWES